MKFSVYFVCAAVAFLVLSAQESDAGIADFIEDGFETIKTVIRKRNYRDTIDIIKEGAKENEDSNVYPEATRVLRDYFINATNLASKAEDIIINGIGEAKKSVLSDNEAAKNIFKKAMADEFQQFFYTGLVFFKPFGAALGLSNEGARPGLSASSQRLQAAGLRSINVLTNIRIFFDQGINGLDESDEVLCDSILLNVESGFADLYKSIQKAIQEAYQGLRDAQNKPIQAQYNFASCKAASKDSQGSVAVKDINDAADNAIKRGANNTLVQKLKNSAICLLSDLVTTTADGKKIVDNVGKIANADASAASTSYFKQIKPIKQRLQNIVANSFIDFGCIALQSGNQLNEKTGKVIESIESGKLQLFLGIKSIGNIMANLEEIDEDALELAIEAASKSGAYGKLTFIEALLRAVKTLFGFL